MSLITMRQNGANGMTTAQRVAFGFQTDGTKSIAKAHLTTAGTSTEVFSLLS